VIQLDCNLEHLALEMGHGFTNEAGVQGLYGQHNSTHDHLVSSSFECPGYEAFISAMLRVNTSLFLKLPAFETDGANAELLESRNQMVIEQRLNEVGRGRLLASRQTTKE
jgi:hypothetical protein